jgi:1,4-dihydroxy-2-naphthoate octaprenyltransferase
MRRRGWRSLSLRAVVELAAPHTWGASVMPVILAAALSWADTGLLSFPLFYSMLATSVCLQSAVNTLNDYSDFISGADTAENCTDPTDQSIIYHDYEPVLAFAVGIGFIGLALLCGLYAVLTAGVMLLAFGAFGAAVLFFYSYGIKPLCYTPLGEFTSGVVMGGIIPFACYYGFTGRFEPWVLVYSIPLVLSIAHIMLTNNACDIEKDAEVNRITMPVRIGRSASVRVHVGMFTAAMAVATIVTLLRFSQGLVLLPLFAAWLIPSEARIARMGLLPENRLPSMLLSAGINVRLNAVYALMIVTPGFTEDLMSLWDLI